MNRFVKGLFIFITALMLVIPGQVEAKEEVTGLNKENLSDSILSKNIDDSDTTSSYEMVSDNQSKKVTPSLVIKKLNEQNQPMKSAFRVTNLNSGESHIISTNENGLSNPLFLSPTFYTRLGTGDVETVKYDKIDEFRKTPEQEFHPTDQAPDIFTENFFQHLPQSLEPNPPLQLGPGYTHHPLPPHPNDRFLDHNQVKSDVYHHIDLDASQDVHFSDDMRRPHNLKGTLNLVITYGYLNDYDNNAIEDYDPNNPPPDEQLPGLERWGGVGSDVPHFIPQKEDVNGELKNLTEVYSYNGISPSDFTNIDLSKILSLAKNRLAALVHQDRVRFPHNGNKYYYYAFSYRLEYVEHHTYKFEEVRLDSNINYDLKNFYVSYSGSPSVNMMMGNDPNHISIPAQSLGPDTQTDRVDVGSINNYQFTIDNQPFTFTTTVTNPDDPGSKVLPKGKTTRVSDKIVFDLLSPGKTYEFKGKLIHKKTQTEVPTTSPILYTLPNLASPKGEVQVDFTFDSSAFKDKDDFVITYDIYEDGKLAGFEHDINNINQTFTIKDNTPPGITPDIPSPISPENPTTAPLDTSQGTTMDNPPTGYNPSLRFYVISFLSSSLALVYLQRKSSRKIK